ncbi:hypothetical protein N0V93_010219 [Gnomoniopsis smithogilvyi]|uniref:Uncharacterized protein n=1 Tax=Gnomoniopsis smithogilvyi TaxID=1191159 RepID=A0A9W8YLK6_9PEZI|nr:hypothetical protein N0V93_010219 [Gnomoniopsis smithogilvyi]
MGLGTLLIIVLIAFLCCRRRQRDGMKTVSQKDAAAYESTSTIGPTQEATLPYSQLPYGGFVSDAANNITPPQQAMVPPRPLGAQVVTPSNNGMPVEVDESKKRWHKHYKEPECGTSRGSRVGVLSLG